MKQLLLIVSIVLILGGVAIAQPTVSNIDPSENNLSASLNSSISIEFSEAMNTATFTSSNIIVQGTIRGMYSGTYSSPINSVAEFEADSTFLPGEEITVILTTGVQNSGNTGMASPYIWSFRAEVEEEGTGVFNDDVTYSAGDTPEDILVADFDNDGDQDIAVSNSGDATISVFLNNGDGTFATAVDYVTGGTAVNSVTSGDIDGDGYIDLVAANNLLAASSNIKVLTNDGDGTFTSAGNYGNGNPYLASDIELGDIDGDGDLDLFATFDFDNTAGRYLNDGTGAFGSLNVYSVGTQPVDIEVGDIDGDNDLDAVVTNMNSNNITILTNNGSGALSAGTLTKSVGTSPRRTILADFDDDGDVDIATTNHNDGDISVYFNQDTGTLSTSFVFPTDYATASFPGGLATVDYDADGDLDLVNTNGDSVSVMVNNGSGSFSRTLSMDVGASARSVAFGDFLGNGEIGFVTSNFSGDDISVLLFAQPSTVTAVSNQNGLNVSASSNITATFSDSMNGSSMVDSAVVITGSRSGTITGVLSYDDPSKTMTFNPTSDFMHGERITMVLTTSVQNAVGVGLAAPGYTSSFTVANGGNGNLVYRDSLVLTNNFSLLNTSDIDGDGDLDLLGNTGSYVDVYEYDAGTFSFLAQSSLPSGFERIYPVDLDGDGDQDLAIHPFIGTNNFRFMENDGSGNYTVTDTLVVSSAPDDVVFEDFDGDGLLDLAYIYGAQITIINWGTGDFSFSGTGTFGGGSGYPTPVAITSGDLNNDGDVDIVVVGSDQVVIGTNQSTRSFDDTAQYDIGENASDVELADFNGDGYLDIVAGSEDGASFSVLINEGDGTFAAAVEYSTSPYFVDRVSTFDYDGDGDIDIGMYVYDDDSGDEYMLFAYNISGTFGNQLLFQFPTSSPQFFDGADKYYTILDFDGDNDLDLVAKVGSSTIAFAENVGGSSTTPTTAASGIATTTKSFEATINWTNGDGARRVVVVKENTAVDASPTDNSGVIPRSEFETGTELGTGNYVVYAGVSNSVTVTGLSAETDYHVSIFELNGIPGQEKILTTGAPTATFTTAAPPTIWSKNDSTLTFTKADNADWTQAANQDRITDNLWITRANSNFIFNIIDEFEADQSISPSGTQWALGTTDDISSLSFGTFGDLWSGNATDIPDTDMVVYVESDNLYFDINFSSWTSGGSAGGFSYTRAKGPEPQPILKTFDQTAGNALRFDDANLYERYLEVYDSDFVIGSEFSIEAWVKLDTIGIEHGVMSLDSELGFGINSENKVYAYHNQPEASSGEGGGEGEGGCCELSAPEINFGPMLTDYAGPSGTVDLTSADTLEQDQWYHIALTGESGGFLKLYINGVIQDSDSVQNVAVEESYWYFGRERDQSEYLYGFMDEVRIWKSERTESQIRSYMHRPYGGDVGRLYGYWQFNEGSGTSTFDGVSNREAEFYDSNTSAWFTSDAPLGEGTVEEASDFQTGTQTVGNASLSMADGFDNPVDIQVTEVTADPNIFPTGFTSGVGGKYFVINLFGDPGTFSADLSLNYGAGVLTSSNPAEYKLFKRGSNSTGAWTEVASAASSVNTGTGEVTWSGITSFSQFMGILDEIEYDIQISDGTDVVAFIDSSFIFGSDFFDLTGDFADSTLTVTLKDEIGGTLFIDINANNTFDSGTDSEITTSVSQVYTPTSANKLVYEPSDFDASTAIIKLSFGDAADSVSLDFFSVEGDPTFAGNTGENGWYLLTNPFTTTLGDLLDQIWTQGAVNSNAPNGDNTIYTFNQDSSRYIAVTTDLDTTKIAAGDGLLVYMFEDDDLGDGQSDIDGGWPKTLNNYGDVFGLNLSVPVKNADNDGVSGTSGSEGFVLFGNPYGWSISADSVIATLKRSDELANSYVYRWNPTAKTYQLISTGAINPYESVFLRVVSSGTETSLNFDYDDKYVASGSKRVAEKLFTFTLSQNESTIQSTLALRFDEKASTSIDPYDGYYLGSFANRFTNLYTGIGDQQLTINNLPLSFDGEQEYPIYLHSTETGTFRLGWENQTLPEGIELSLENRLTGETLDLTEESSMEFSVGNKFKSVSGNNAALTFGKSKQAIEPVFILRAKGNAVNNEDDLGIPREVELYQNYPNPFNPSSVIRYGVPEQARVQLQVFDVLGRKVMTLIDGDMKQPGRYNISFNARDLASGMYIYRLVIGDKVLTKKMTLIK
jgi:hypothetical protein